MAKLIYLNLNKAGATGNDSLIKDGSYAWNNSNNKYYNSLVFTSDGHLLTHGIDYSIASTITSVAAISGGKAGNILYLSALGVTNFISTPSDNGNYVVNYNGTTPSLVSIANSVKFRLNLEIDHSNWTNALGTDILNGTGIYAPIASGTAGQILSSNGANKAPTWKSLTSTGSTDALAIPTLAKVEELISTASTSLLLWQGDTASVPTTAATKVGYAWRVSANITLPATNSITGEAQTLEIGDILICTTAYSASPAVTPKFTVAQTNWTGSAGASALSWNEEITLATIGGISIKAKLPANPNTDTDTTYNFYVGASETTSNNASTTNPWLTYKPSSSNSATNILLLNAGTGIKVETDGTTTKKINITNTGVTGYTATVTNTTTGYYTIGTLTINGSNVNVYGKDTNTWRDVKVNKVGLTAATSTDSTLEQLKSTSINTGALEFGSAFGWVDADNERKVELAWEEIYLDGSTTKYKYYV